MAKNRNIWLFAFFTALLFIKVSALHVYSHTEDDWGQVETCLYCELAIENQNTQLAIPVLPTFDISNFVFLPAMHNYNFHISPISKGVFAKKCCRPPPSMV